MLYPLPKSSNLEFKRDIPKNDQIIKTIIGFCNQTGGKPLIGVNDNGTIEGISTDAIEDLVENLEKTIYESTFPPIIPRISLRRFGQKNIIEIEVSSGMNKPYFRKSEGKEHGTYIRLGKTTLKATFEIIQELEWSSRGQSYESLGCYCSSVGDLDLNKFQEFLSHRINKASAQANLAMLSSYGLIQELHTHIYPTHAGILLFANNPQKFLSESMIICSHFAGNSGREVIATIDSEGDLFQQFRQSYEFILSRLYKSFKIEGALRKESLEIPEVAIREALLNAIVHRNYHIQAPSKIAIYDNRVEIFSPGQFPGPLNTQNLKDGVTYLRNPIICKVMREAGYIEKMGSGLITIFESYEKYGLDTPEIIEGENFIKCILPRTKKTESKASNEDLILKLFEKK